MKRSERHHLKENELALTLDHIRDQFDSHKNRIYAGTVAVVVVAAAIGGFFWYRQHVDNAARTMLASAMAVQQAQVYTPATATAQVPPLGAFASEQAKLEMALRRFMEAADAYPSTRAGIAARFEAAGCLLQLGRAKEAADRFREVIDRDGDGLYGDMARMGLGESQIASGQYDAAIASYREMTNKATVPADAVLMQLGRAYAMAGKSAEARQTFKRILDEFPQSQYAAAAKKEFDAVQAPAA